MDRLALGGKILEFGKKYRYALLVVLIGLALMLLPGKNSDTKVSESQPVQETAPVDISQQLAQILCQIQGAGKVQVMLTIAEGEKIMYQTDEDLASGDTGTSRWDTVIVTGADRGQSGLIQQVIPPVYRGAIVVCQGAHNATVRLEIVEAVSKITGLGADKISVVKMK